MPRQEGIPAMKNFIASVVLVTAAFGLSSAVGADAPNRPPGVSAMDWVPISDSAGIVLLHIARPQLNRTPLDLVAAPRAEGYLMVKRAGGGWQRLVIVEPLKGPGPAG